MFRNKKQTTEAPNDNEEAKRENDRPTRKGQGKRSNQTEKQRTNKKNKGLGFMGLEFNSLEFNV